ncbi:MAG: UDP-N-acetylmuramate--L-alanine ligase [Candidatus Riflebacteria bacterium]|nr:UDP-N-acetylmuramate--L-alanine ligase [Candidatus Riflebacteria bacterium]
MFKSELQAKINELFDNGEFSAQVEVESRRWFSRMLKYFRQSKEAGAAAMNHDNGIHFIGIGGIGMSGLAQILIEKGFAVSGSDIRENAQTRKLAAMGAEIYFGHSSQCLPESVKRVVVSTAIESDNVELQEARRRNLAIFHRSDLLAELFNNLKFGIAVSGCHGKTTVTSILSTIFSESAMDPTCVVGGNVQALQGNARNGHSEYLIAEADESDATFLKYFPHTSIITNIDNDHMDHYSSLDAIVKAFEVFASHNDPDGSIFICQDDPIVRNIALPEDRRIVTYGIDNPADYMAEDIKLFPFGSFFRLKIGGVDKGMLELALPGKHNVLNALPAVAIALEAGISLDQIQDALKKFHGAGRRFELKGNFHGITVIDDYGHHPNEIRATLAAAKSLAAKRVMVVFQPHRYTRTQLLCSEFGRCFEDCDRLFLTDIYPASEKAIEGVSSKLILDHMPVAQRRKVKMVKSTNEALYQLMETLEDGDVVFTLGAGDVTQLGPVLIDAMKSRSELSAARAV